jgi:hypothetical protein
MQDPFSNATNRSQPQPIEANRSQPKPTTANRSQEEGENSLTSAKKMLIFVPVKKNQKCGQLKTPTNKK